MKIDFYEEFPTKENLEKLKFVDFPTRVFIAARSFKEFKKLEKKIINLNKKVEVAFWPIVKNSYWVSPFSNTKDLIELFRKLDNCHNQILIDLEFPLNKKMIFKNLFHCFKNKKIIKNFLNKNKITTAQFPNSLISWFMKLAGLNYNVNLEKSLMWYSSVNSDIKNKNIKKQLIKLKNKNNYSISLGVIAAGILGDELILSPRSLERDLKFIKNAGFERVVIFRLGGLNKEYMKVLKKFI